MPARRELTMRQLRQMLRLHHDGVSAREIGRTLGVARSTIQDNLERARKAGIGWPLPIEWSDEVLEQRLFARSGVKPGRRRRCEPDWTALARELKRPGVNLMVLWEEYRLLHADGYGYSRFCDLYREFERRLSPVMRQHHVAGDKVFVDYSGKKIAIVNPATGEVREAEIFVAVLGASNYIYAEATWTQTLPDWIEAHVHMFRFFGGVPRLVVPDNLKSGVNKASFYDVHDNLILCGPTGVGKSWLASALGHKACRDNRSVLYQRFPKLFADLALARGDGRYARILRALGGVQLLILDDWGLEPLDAAARHDLLEILEERYGRRSTIITSQIPVDKWHDLIGDPTYADAILDRIVHNAHRINLTGHSLRRSRASKTSKE
jgi:transposase